MVGGLAQRMLDRQGYAGAAVAHRRPRPRARRRRLRAGPDPRGRPGGAAARRDDPASRAGASARRRPARAGSQRRSARCRWCSTSRSARANARPTARGSWTSRTRSGSSRVRCSTRATARSGCATSRSASSARSPARWGSSPNASWWTRWASTTSRGSGPSTWTGGTCSATCWRGTWSAADQAALPAELIRELGAIPSYYLRYFYTEDERLAELRTEKPRAQEVAEIERELLGMYRDESLPRSRRCSSGAAARSTARPRHSSWPRSPATPATRRWWTCVTAARSQGWRTTTWSRCRRGWARAARSRCRSAPLAPELLGLVQHVAAYERLAAEAAVSARRRDRGEGDARAPARGPVAAVEASCSGGC